MARVGIERCACGDTLCGDHWLTGAGKFVQGSGFTETEARRIADLLNGERPVHLAARKALDEIRAHWTRDELAEQHCGMEVALDALMAALEGGLGV